MPVRVMTPASAEMVPVMLFKFCCQAKIAFVSCQFSAKTSAKVAMTISKEIEGH
jgi:hypothetical protein